MKKTDILNAMNSLTNYHRKIRRILIRSTNWIGDAIMTTPAVRAIRNHFPHAHITMLAKPWVVPVFANSPHVDQIISYDENLNYNGLKGKIQLINDLREQKFDTAILLQNAIEAAIIAFFSGIPMRVGFNTDGRHLLLTHPIQCTKEIKQIHQTRYYVRMLEGAGINSDGYDLELYVGNQDRQYAYQFLCSIEKNPNIKWIGINPSATYGNAKQWFPERFAQLADKICESYNAGILIFGGPKDRDLGEKVRLMMNNPAVNLAGKTSLGQAIALIQQCHVFVTNDSGLMHIACALKTPLAAIFGSTNPITTGPIGKNTQIVQVPTPCSPCLKTDCPKPHHTCMDSVSVESVFKTVKDLLL
ncbi:ADP-heptose:LPS heptosyltransferase [Candidatus Magnetomorum sp. HK-1]|nr:ADP-heptose:LPS heptosyltransferase [Candidatus Magnetomorum sp. HK-1]